MSSTTVLHDPEGRIEGTLPLDRETHQCLAQTVLAWQEDPALETADYQQIALLLAGAARAVAGDVRRAAAQMPQDHQARVLADLVLEEAERRLSIRLEGTVRCVQGRARLVRDLYERLDRLAEIERPKPVRAVTASPVSSLFHQSHPWLGRNVEDTATGRRGTLRAIAPDGDTPRPVAWLRPPGGGTEWTTDPAALAAPAPITPHAPPP